MTEVTGIVPPTVEVPRTSGHVDKTKANSYETRSIRVLQVDGVEGEWHSVKGGMDSSTDRKSTPIETLKYGVLYNPNTRTWLKAVPPEALGTPHYEVMEARLRRSALQQQISLVESGLPDLAQQVKKVEVEIDGQKVDGFTSPHIGPSLESFIFSLTGKRRSRDLPPEFVDLLSTMYSAAAHQAERLLLQYGIWMADPNPGNILLRHDENGTHIVLIDFLSKHQEAEYLFTNLSREKYPGGSYVQKLKNSLLGQVRGLHQRFAFYCDRLGIPFVRDQKDISANINDSVAVVNARKMLTPLPAADQ